MRRDGGYFLIFAGIYILSASGHIHSIDSYQVYNVTKSLAERGTLEIPESFMEVQGPDGEYYSKFGVGQSVLAYPLFKLAQHLYKHCPDSVLAALDKAQGRLRTRLGEDEASPQFLEAWPRTRGDPFYSSLITLLFNPMITALCLVLLMRLLRQLGHGQRAALVTACAAGFATFLWPLARDFLQHPLTTLLLLLELLIFEQGKGRLGPGVGLKMGLVAGAALLVRLFTATWTPIFGLALTHELHTSRASRGRWLGTAAAYLAPLALAGGVLLLLNQWRFGAPMSFGYHTDYDEGFSTPLLTGLYVNLLHDDRSLLLFAPPIVAALLGLRAFYRRHARLSLMVGMLAGCYLLIYSKWWAYDGGWCIGPRFLAPLVPLLLLPLAGLLEGGGRWHRAALIVQGLTMVLGVGLQLIWMSLEYTSIYTINSQMFSVPDYVRAILQSGWWGLDFWYLNVAHDMPGGWYALFLAFPLAFIGGGLYLVRSRKLHVPTT